MVSKAVFSDNIKAHHISKLGVSSERLNKDIYYPVLPMQHGVMKLIYTCDLYSGYVEIRTYSKHRLWLWWCSIDKEVQITQGCIPDQSKTFTVKAVVWLRKTQLCMLNLLRNNIFSKQLSRHLQFPYPLSRHEIIQIHLFFLTLCLKLFSFLFITETHI